MTLDGKNRATTKMKKSVYTLFFLLFATSFAFGQENKIITQKLNNKYTYVNYYDGYYTVNIGTKKGLCDLNGKEIIAPTNKYTDIFTYYAKYGYYLVKNGDKIGLCDLNGNEVASCQFSDVLISTSNKIRVKYHENDDYVDYTPVVKNLSLTDSQKEKCKTDIEYLYQMANKGYAEAEYMLAMKIYYDGFSGEVKYEKYWSSFDEKNNYVGAAHYFKKACEHGWHEAYDIYADFCFYGRGNAKGGLNEAIKWEKKAFEADSSDWTVVANLAWLYLMDEDNSNDDSGIELLQQVVKMQNVEKDFFCFLGIALYYGIGVKMNKKAACYYFQQVFLAEEEYKSDSDIKATMFRAYCFYYGIGVSKDETTAESLLKRVTIGGYPSTINDCIKKIAEYDKEYSQKSLRDIFLLF